MKRVWKLIEMTAVVLALGAPSSYAQEVTWAISTSRGSYWLGEQVVLHLEACNVGSVARTVDMNAAPGVLNAAGDPVWAPTLLPWVNNVEIPPGQCRSANDQFWDQRDIFGPFPYQQVPPGWYRGEFLSSEQVQYYSPDFLIQQRVGVPVSKQSSTILALLIAVAGWIAVCRMRSS